MKKYKFRLLKLSFIIIILSLIGTLYIKKVYGNSDTGFLSGSIAESIDNDNTPEFVAPYEALTQNDIYAEIYIPPSLKTDWLRITDFNFNLPDNSIIEGIEVQIDDYGFVYTLYCYLVLNGNSIGINKETYIMIPSTDTDTYRTYGSSTDIWNTELTKFDIENSTFGFQICYNSGYFALVDHIQIKIYYSISEPEPEPEPNIDFIIIFGLISIFSIMILILLFSILLIKNGK